MNLRDGVINLDLYEENLIFIPSTTKYRCKQRTNEPPFILLKIFFRAASNLVIIHS